MLSLAAGQLNVELGDQMSSAADTLSAQPEKLREQGGELRVIIDEIGQLVRTVSMAADFDRSAQAILGATENLAMASGRVTPQSRTVPFLWGFFFGAVLVAISMGLFAYSTRGA